MSDTPFDLKDEIESSLWDKKVKESKQGSLFNTSLWSWVVKETFGLENRILGVYKNDNLIGGCNLFYKTKHGLKVITRIPISNCNGLLFFNESESKSQKESQIENSIIEVILNEISRNYKFCILSLHPSIKDVRIFMWNNWRVLPQYTYILPLENEEKIWDNFSSSLRRKISRANEQKYKFVEENNISGLLKLHEESYSRKNIKPLLDSVTLKRYYEIAKSKNLVRIFSIYGENNVLYSSRAILVWNNTVYDWIAGTGIEFLSSNATHLLVWNILKKIISEGYRSFDFMGANTPGIIDFKKSFGGNLCTTYDVTYYSSRFISFLFKINNSIIKLKRGL